MTDRGLASYIPIDRHLALAGQQSLPHQAVGTALFADISGFTPLTAVLVKELGARRGAEEVLRHINPVYEALITELYRYQGSVISFAGDSITCWFDEKREGTDDTSIELAQSAARALACGLAMQRAMDQWATIKTVAGTTISIALKIALAAGTAQRLVVGDPAIQMIDTLAGETIARVAATETLAQKGEVIASEEVIEAVGKTAVLITNWRQSAPNGPRYALISALLRPVMPAPWPEAAALAATQVQPWLLSPLYERLQSGGSFLAELRPAVALFLKFDGLDYDHDTAVNQKLDAYIRWVQAVLWRYEGYLLQLTIGDKGSYLYAAFGAPLAHDDDAARAIAAALDLRTPPPEMPFITKTQIGLSQGRMWSGACGAVARRTYGVMGEEVNMAARLMSKADAGQILVSQRLAEATPKLYRFNDLGLITVKGKERPLAIAEVVGRQTAVSRQPAHHLYPHPLIGREETLATLHQIRQTARQQQGQIIQLEGATGIGKSHLMAVFGQQASTDGWRLAIGYCSSIDQSIAYVPWRQLFYSLLKLETTNLPPEQLVAQVETAVAAINPDWLVRLPLLGDLLGLPIPDNPTTAAFDAQLRQKSLFALVLAMLQTWAKQQPLLLMIEDIHWLDDASSALTTAVGRALAQEPILLVFDQRPVVEARLLPLHDQPNHHYLVLNELSATNISALVSNRLQGAVSPLLLSLIAARTEGNPFFAEELVDSLREAGSLVQDENGRWTLSDSLQGRLHQAGCLTQQNGEWVLANNVPLTAVAFGVPDSIQGIILSRIDRLLESHKLLLKVASVIGQRFDLTLLTLAHPPVQPALGTASQQMVELNARDFIRIEQEQMAFDRAMSDATYAFRHNTIQEVAYDMLLFEQRQQLHRRVSNVLVELQPDNVSTVAHHAFLGKDWLRALEYHLLAGRQEQRFALHEAIDHYQKALICCDQLPVDEVTKPRLQIYLGLGELLTRTGQYETAEQNLHQALTLATEQKDENGRAQACRWLARLHELRGAYAPALDWVQKGLVSLSNIQTADAAEIMLIAGLINTRKGDYETATALADNARQIATHLGDINIVARAHNLSGIIIRLRGNRTAAIEAFQKSFELYAQANNIHGQALAQNQIATAWFDMGNWVKADYFYRQARNIFTQTGDVYNLVLVHNNLGGIALNQGRLDEALTYYQLALRSQKETGGSAWVLGALYMNLGHTFIRRKEPAKALENLNTGLDHFTKAQARDFLPELYRLLAAAALLTGAFAESTAHIEKSLALAREMGARSEEGIGLRVKGELALGQADFAEAAAALTESLTILDEAGDRYEGARTALVLAQLYAVQGQKAQQEAMLARCMPAFTELEAALDLAEAQALL